jgi:hypothetical protein
MDENQSLQIKVIEKVNIQYKEEVHVIKVKNHVKGWKLSEFVALHKAGRAVT